MDKEYTIAIAAIIFAILHPTLIGWNNYRANLRMEKEKLTLLLSKFKYAKSITFSTKNNLYSYTKANNAYDEYFMQGLTFRQCIQLLNEADEILLSRDTYETLKSLRQLPINFEDLKAGIEAHIKHVTEVDTIIKLFLKRE